MALRLSRAPTERIRRVDLLAYVVGVMGVTFVADNAVDVLTEEASAYAVGMGTVGVFALVAAASFYRDPSNLRKGTEPAPAYLYVLPVVSTVAAAVMASSWVLRLT
jgi:hypothetical protein